MNRRPVGLSYPLAGAQKLAATVSRLDVAGGERFPNAFRWLLRLPVPLAALVIGLFLCDGVLSLRDPFFFRNERWQGFQIVAAARVLEHQTLYPDVLTDASYYIYTPGVPILHAATMALFGKGLLSLKVLSFLLCGVSLAGVAVGAYGLTHSRSAAWVATGLFAATHRFLAGWPFFIRPDVSAGAFAIWGLVLWTREADRPHGRVLRDVSASLCFLLAAWCKQNYLILIALHLGFLLWRRGWRYAFTIAAPLTLLGLALLLPYATGEEHLLSTTRILAQHPLRWWTLRLYLYPYLTWSEKTLLFLLTIECLVFAFNRRARCNWRAIVWVDSCVVLLAVSTVVAAKWGSDVNSYYLFCLILGLPLVWAMYRRENPASSTICPSLHAAVVSVVVSIFLTAQVFTHLLPLALYHPTYADRECRNLDRLYTFIQEHRDARIYYPMRNYLTWLGADQYWHCDLMTEALFHAGEPAPPVIMEQIVQRQFDYIIGGLHTHPVSITVKRNYQKLYPSPVPGFDIYVPKPRT
jgi:hypothetical protein